MGDFTKKNFFVWLEISRGFLSDEGLFVEKGHLSLSFSASLLLMPLLGVYTFKKKKKEGNRKKERFNSELARKKENSFTSSHKVPKSEYDENYLKRR